MSSDYYGSIAGETADEGAAGGSERNPDICGTAFCEDGWHECSGYCGSCGIHLDEHGPRCNEYATEGLA